AGHDRQNTQIVVVVQYLSDLLSEPHERAFEQAADKANAPGVLALAQGCFGITALQRLGNRLGDCRDDDNQETECESDEGSETRSVRHTNPPWASANTSIRP